MNLYHTQSTKQFVEGTTPTAPPSGVVTLFASASALNVIDSGGNVTEIGGGGGGGVTVSDTSPSSPANGDLWFNSDTGSLYVWYVDADGGQWVLPDLNISTGIISLSSQVAHILPVENGGTGASSLSSVSLSSFSSESATDGYVATADGAGSIVWEEAAVGLTNFTEGRDDTGVNASTPVVSLSATGAETNIDAAIIPKGTGALLTAIPDGTAAGGNKRGSGAIDLQIQRTNADQVANVNGVCIGNLCKTTGGGSGKVAIGYGCTTSDSLGGGVALGRNSTAGGYRSVAIGYGAYAGSDAIAIGTAAAAAHNAAICIGAGSVFSGRNLWKGGTITPSQYNRSISVGGEQIGYTGVRTIDDSPSNIASGINTTGFVNSNFRHRGILINYAFTLGVVRSDGAISKFERNLYIKDLYDPLSSTYNLEVLSLETVGTDITEISDIDFGVVIDQSNRTFSISVSGQSPTSVTGDAATDTITSIGHPFNDGDIVIFNELTGGAGLTTNLYGQYYYGHYVVSNKTVDTFQLVNANSQVYNFTTDITGGLMSRPILWHMQGKYNMFAGGY